MAEISNRANAFHSSFENRTTESAMSTTIAAFIATLIVTGMTSAVSHDITTVGGSAVALVFGCSALLSRRAAISPAFLFGAIAMSVLALVSSEANCSPFSSTIHVLACYVALGGLACASPDMSSFCRQVIMSTNLLLTVWVLYQGFGVRELNAWQISNPSGAGNLMAAQINMTLPFVLLLIHKSNGARKTLFLVLLSLNCCAVFLVMSRNGIGGMLIILTLYFMYNHKRLAVLAAGGIVGIISCLDRIIQLPWIYDLLVRLRIIGFKPVAPRSLIWDVAFDYISGNPALGVGPGKPKKLLAVIDIYHAHNNFIQVALETGIPAAAIFTLLILGLLWLCGKSVLRSREESLATLPILAYLSYSWTGTPLAYPGATLLLAVCVNEARVAMKHGDELRSRRQFAVRGPILHNALRAA